MPKDTFGVTMKMENKKNTDLIPSRIVRFFLVLLSLVLAGAQMGYAQKFKLTGTVWAEDSGETLPGATVKVLGTNRGVATDMNGFYSIDIFGDSATVLFSFIGYEAKEYVVKYQTVLDVRLRLDINNLDEVTVIGYGTTTKKDLTGSVTKVKGETFSEQSPLSVQNALAGRVAGVQITQTDNAPGAGVNVLIRGGSSLTGGNQPLYVIDGFPIVPNAEDRSSNPLADLSPSQIESIEVLKDASATAVYGAQGANGVIIITTNKGKAGITNISADVSFGVSQMANYPDILSPKDFALLQIKNIKEYSYQNVRSRAASLEFWENMADSSFLGKNWMEEISRVAVTKNVDVGLSGKSNGLSYATSLNFLDQEGIILGSKFQRLNLNLNLNQQLGDKAKIGSFIKYATSENTGLVNTWEESSIIKKALQSNPFIPDDFSVLSNVNTDSEAYSWNNDNVTNYIESVDRGFTTSRIIGNLFLDYEPLPGLNLYTSFGLTKQLRDEFSFLPKDSQQGVLVGGRADFRKRDFQRYVYQARATYNTRFQKHRLNVTGVFEATKNEQIDYFSRVENFGDDSRGIYDLSSASTIYVPINTFADNSILSYLGRLNYSYAGKYFLTASLRADASSKFGANNRWGYFPSVALAWVISEEKFLKSLSAINFLKLRTSVGVTGNNQIPSYNSLAYLDDARYVFNDQVFIGYSPANLANPDLRWETTTQINLGVDIELLDSRISITSDVYYKKTTDLLLQVQLPTSSGYDQAIRNVGSISNKGFELAITSTNIDNNRLKWTSSFTFSTNRSEVLDLGDANEMFFTRGLSSRVDNDILVRVGEQIGIYYGFIEDGILNSQTEIANSPPSTVLENMVGQVKLFDVNGDGVITNEDKVPIAKTVPDFIGGLHNSLQYGPFDLSFFFRWSFGNDVINGNTSFIETAGTRNWNTLYAYSDNRYSPANPSGTIHGSIPDTYQNLMRSSYVEDGSFLKLDYVTLGYTYPKQLLNNKINSVRMYVRVTNPWMLTRYSWFDPEVSTGWGTAAQVGPGADLGTFPRSNTFTLGLSLKL